MMVCLPVFMLLGLYQYSEWLAVYSLSAVFNLIHLKKKRDADYIIVLGQELLGVGLRRYLLHGLKNPWGVM